MSCTRRSVLFLYKRLLRESQKFAAYNFRMYASRKIRATFRDNKAVSGDEKISKLVNFAEENLNIIRRQAIIGHLYSTEKLVIER